MTIINVLNFMVFLLFVMTVIHFYNKYTEYFFAMLIIIVYWAQLLVSSTYIETGVYLKDIGKISYATGVTIRLFLMIELMLGVIMYFASRHRRLDAVDVKNGKYTYKDFRIILLLLLLMYVYRFVDILISGNILTNSSVTRFNYFSDYSSLPMAQVIDYFSYPCLWILGYILLLGETKKQKAFPIFIFVLNMFAVLLRGVQFGGFLQSTLYFLGPMLLLMAKKRKLLKLRYAVIAVAMIIIMLIPKYNHFDEAVDEGYADTSYGLSTAFDFLMYRMFAQEADLTWEIDRQVWEDGEIDPDRYFEIIKEIIGIPVEDNSTQYLMNRGCSPNALLIYSYGPAAVTGGYPIIWAAMFGYFFMIPFLMVDAYLIFLVVRCICEGMVKQRMFLLLAGGYLFHQVYTVAISANFSALGNTIPHIFVAFLLLLYKRSVKLTINKHAFRI